LTEDVNESEKISIVIERRLFLITNIF